MKILICLLPILLIIGCSDNSTETKNEPDDFTDYRNIESVDEKFYFSPPIIKSNAEKIEKKDDIVGKVKELCKSYRELRKLYDEVFELYKKAVNERDKFKDRCLFYNEHEEKTWSEVIKNHYKEHGLKLGSIDYVKFVYLNEEIIFHDKKDWDTPKELLLLCAGLGIIQVAKYGSEFLELPQELITDTCKEFVEQYKKLQEEK